MSWKLNTENENPLWRQYMDFVDMNSSDTKWLKEIDLRLPNLPNNISSKTHCNYSEEEFLEMIENDEEFKKEWGTLK